jgi:Tol biopolymer transport system component
MVLRTASLGDRFDPYERVSSVSPIWPGGQRVYIYGSLFLEHLEQQYGAGTTARMVQKTASAVLPPFLLFGDIGRRTIGKSFGSAFREWRDTLRVQYEAQADSLRATGLTVAERITEQGRIALFPRISPDGERIAYAAVDGREDAATRVLARSDGRRLHAWRRNSVGALAWLPDGSSVVLSQLEFDGPYRARQDLWVVGEDGERRITHQARLQDPDVARSGRIVAIENMDGTNRPVLVDMEGNTRTLVDARADVHWALPRWSPDGTRVASARWTGGQYAILVLDTLGRTIREMPDEGVATAPAWSPDGRYIVYSSDRTGIANLYAADITEEPVRVRQITQVLTGAFTPELSPDGAELVFAAYAADGFHIERLPFDTTTWREPGPVRVPLHAHGDPPAPAAVATQGSAAQTVTEARAWSPLPTMRPYYWEPALDRRAHAGDFWGFQTGGEDVIGRHRWGARFVLDPDNGRWGGSVAWQYARLGVPVLQLEAARAWDDLGFVRLPDSTFTSVLEREDALAVFANFPVRRWRNSANFSLGGVWERASRGLLAAPDSVRLRDARDDLFSVVGRVGFANYRTHELSISREDGISVAMSGRVTREKDPVPDFPRDYEEVSGSANAYKALPLGGFARPVIALRASGLRRFNEGASPTSIGGESGSVYDLLGLFELGDGGLLLPVRGFERGVRAGTRAWTASAELRVPVAIPGRRLPLTPFYFDRISLSLFGDAGDSSCSAAEAERFLSCERANLAGDPLLSAGAELVTELGIGSWFYTRVRVGLAQPVNGPGNSPRAYLQFGSAF